MNTNLWAFLRRLSRADFDWETVNCGLPLADLWMAEHGVDPATVLRAECGNEATCMAMVARSGHLPRLVARLARQVGARRRMGDWQPGDLAVVRGSGTWFGAIRTPDGFWAIKAHDGLLITRDVRVVAAWSL